MQESAGYVFFNVIDIKHLKQNNLITGIRCICNGN